MVWTLISLDRHGEVINKQHIIYGEILIGKRSRCEILDPYTRPYSGAIGDAFMLWMIMIALNVPFLTKNTGEKFRKNRLSSSIPRYQEYRAPMGLPRAIFGSSEFLSWVCS
ncbi:hypothetical protein AVEN_118019-1 [Araneus ventricosus]|uniref:Uncharacterized protein n=1 Tax=Araneus ventricosus TaxID=182803 RepID=A0A4Y2C8J5_ARAVE|nr:hypothetical protein AVEN_118019-1 [Araneus ventricosus]